LLNGEPIPFLDELFAELLSKIEINVEIKDIDTDLCDKLVEIAKPYNIAGRVVVSSFESQPLEYLSENFPEIDIACLYGDVGRWPQMSYASPLVFMARTRAKIIHPWTHWLTPSFMDQAKSRGWKVYTYSEMNGDEARDPEGVWTTLKTLGVDGHCTNFPREFKAWLTQLERRTID
jgi:glycerophosphoryl diester phosphodiesterase